MSETEKWFDDWIKAPFLPRKSRVEEIVDAHLELYDDFYWLQDQEDMYWEGMQGEPSTMEEFDEDTRDIDQRAYEEWLRS